jgi:hypothetical protein
VKGSVLFAATGPNTRKATVVVFLTDMPSLGSQPWETPFGCVRGEGFPALEALFSGYGDVPQCGGRGPDPLRIEAEGSEFIRAEFPQIDFILSAEPART